jgi:hypothetical protein
MAQPSMTGGGSFGSMFASTGGINAFLEGPWQDLTEGLASVITKDNSYRAYINEKRSARKRGRLTNALQPLETISTMLAKEPRLAKVFGPGGAYDGMLQTQVALARASLAENGLPPELADQYTMVIGALSQLDEEVDETPEMKNLRYAQERGIEPGTPEWVALGLGEQKVDKPDYLTPYTDNSGNRMQPVAVDGEIIQVNLGKARDERELAFNFGQAKLNLAMRSNGLQTGDPNIDRLDPAVAQKVAQQLQAMDPFSQLLSGVLGGEGGAAPAPAPAPSGPAVPQEGAPSPSAPGEAQPMPPDPKQLVAGQTYLTPRGKAIYNGDGTFTAVP